MARVTQRSPLGEGTGECSAGACPPLFAVHLMTRARRLIRHSGECRSPGWSHGARMDSRFRGNDDPKPRLVRFDPLSPIRVASVCSAGACPPLFAVHLMTRARRCIRHSGKCRSLGWSHGAKMDSRFRGNDDSTPRLVRLDPLSPFRVASVCSAGACPPLFVVHLMTRARRRIRHSGKCRSLGWSHGARMDSRFRGNDDSKNRLVRLDPLSPIRVASVCSARSCPPPLPYAR